MELSVLTTKIEQRFPGKAKELHECLQLIDSVLEDIGKEAQQVWSQLFDKRDLGEITEYVNMVDAVGELQKSVRSVMSLLAPNYNEPNEESGQETDEKIEVHDTEVKCSASREDGPHGLDVNFTDRKPVRLEIRGQVYSVNHWKEVLICTCQFLMSVDRDRFVRLVNDPSMQGLRYPFFSTNKAALSGPELVGEAIYAGTKLSANSIRDRIKRLLAKFDIPLSDVRIYSRRHQIFRQGSGFDDASWRSWWAESSRFEHSRVAPEATPKRAERKSKEKSSEQKEVW